MGSYASSCVFHHSVPTSCQSCWRPWLYSYCSLQVDIFSYGIILCEIIGRVHSSPEEIPRTNVRKALYNLFAHIHALYTRLQKWILNLIYVILSHFRLDVDKFCEIVQGCPPEFLQLAVCCCQVSREHELIRRYRIVLLSYALNCSVVQCR